MISESLARQKAEDVNVLLHQKWNVFVVLHVKLKRGQWAANGKQNLSKCRIFTERRNKASLLFVLICLYIDIVLSRVVQ